jgi:hypothetical protein
MQLFLLYLYITKIIILRIRGGNRAGRVGFRFGSDGSGQFDFLEEIRSNQVGLGSGRVNLYVVFFFRSLIDFD